MNLLYGLATGVIFGFFLQRAHVLRYDKHLGALRLRDLTIVKFMLAHIVVAMVGIALLTDLGVAKLAVKAMSASYLPSADFAALQADELRTWAPVVEASGFRPE